MTRTHFVIKAFEDHNLPYSIATSITVEVPTGLTRTEAVDYVVGKVAGEMSRYFAHECLALGPTNNQTDWKAKVT